MNRGIGRAAVLRSAGAGQDALVADQASVTVPGGPTLLSEPAASAETANAAKTTPQTATPKAAELVLTTVPIPPTLPNSPMPPTSQAFESLPPSPVWPTESTRLRQAWLDTVPGPVAVLRLLGSARPADVAPVLAALSTDQLTEAVATVELPLAPAVVAQISQRGPALVRRMLARRLVQQPEHVPPRPLGLDAYLRVLIEDAPADADLGAAVARIRALALEALCAGTLTAEQVLDHTRPAALALSLAVCTPAEYPRAWFRRATGDVRVLLARRLAEELGEDDERWSAAINLSGSFGGSVAELVHSDETPGSVHRFLNPYRSAYASQNVLLALAPREVAARYLAALVETRDAYPVRPRTVDYKWDWMLGSGPLSRPLVERVVTRGHLGQRRRLFGNDLCPDYVLEQVHAGYAREVLLRKINPPHVLSRAFRAYAEREPAHEMRAWAAGMLGRAGDRSEVGGKGDSARADSGKADKVVDLAFSLIDAPDLLCLVVAGVLDRADAATLTCLYGALAEAAGPEPVWALDLERAGTLDAVLPQVRASMAVGSAEPLLEAAARTPRRHWIDVLDAEQFGCQGLRAEAELDRTGHFPLEAQVAAHLDGRRERWAEVARRLAAGAVPVQGVIADVIDDVADVRPAVSASIT
jgi:hypothetical protein